MKKHTIKKLLIMIKLTIDQNDKNMVPSWGCNFTKMAILACSFCLFRLGFNHVMCRASVSFHLIRFCKMGFQMFEIWDFLSLANCSLILTGKRHLVSPIKQDWHPAQTCLERRTSDHLANSLYLKTYHLF